MILACVLDDCPEAAVVVYGGYSLCAVHYRERRDHEEARWEAEIKRSDQLLEFWKARARGEP